MEVTKRDGSLEKLNLNKFHTMVEEACDGLAGVSISQVEMNSGIQFYDKITSTEIQQILVRSASDLISVDAPNYQFVAARLLMFGLNKDVYLQFDPIPLKELIIKNVDLEVYDKEILNMFTDDEFKTLESFIKFDRDYTFTYAGLQQVVDKYLVQNRVTGECFETPQYMYLMIAATLFGNYPKHTRMKYIKKYYDAISTFKISIPTPIMSGVRTPIRQFASCVLIDVGDSMDSLLNSNTAVGKYTSRRAGIGLNFGRVRGINAKIRGGEVIHTGVIPFLKVFEATVKSCQQNGVRGGCLKKNTKTLVVTAVEIDGVKYDVNDVIDGVKVIDIINNHNGDKTIMIGTTLNENQTQIKIHATQRNVQDITISTPVLTYNTIAEDYNIYNVSDTFVPLIPKQNQVKLSFDGVDIYSSNIHPFYDGQNKTWVKPEEFNIIQGVNVNNKLSELVKDNSYSGEVDEVFYDFTVPNTHAYFVGQGDKFILTHNSATTHFPIFHWEIEDIIVLKNNKGTDDNRIRKLDYSILTSKLFYTRFMRGEDMTLFSPEDVPELFESFGTPEFDELYEKCERKTSIRKRKINANDLFMTLIQERAETGRIYIMNVDHANTHSSFNDLISMSNLCQEITLPTTPISHIDDTEGEISTCILSALNLGKISSLDDIEELSDLMVRSLDELIDYQDYPVAAAANATRKRRSLGIGYIGLAHYLAKNKVGYHDKEAWQLVHDTTEALQYYLLKASNHLAMERGECEWFDKTKYALGQLPIDHYKKDIDKLINPTLNYDWEELRNNINKYGLRNSTLTAQMPSESSSSVSNETNGIEPPRDYVTVKKSKKGTLKQIVPGYSYLKNQYTLLWDMDDMSGYLNIVGIMQKFFDQSISTNTSYNPQHYPNNEVPTSVFARDILTAYKLGIKTLYYHQTFDGKVDDSNDECDSCAI